MNTKICCTCKVEKEATNEIFGKNKSSKDGLQAMCKECKREYAKQHYHQNKEYYTQKNERWRSENEGYSKEWYIENKESHNETCKQWYQNNKEMHREICRDWAKKNKESLISYSKRWRKENPEKIRLYSRKNSQTRLAIKSKLVADFTSKQWRDCLAFFDYRCAYCGNPHCDEESLQQDHFIPLSKNGGYTKSNIIPACRSCNISKHANDFFEWYPSRSYYDKEKEQIVLKYLGISVEEANLQSPFLHAEKQ